jgi:hypothetical protein
MYREQQLRKVRSFWSGNLCLPWGQSPVFAVTADIAQKRPIGGSDT